MARYLPCSPRSEPAHRACPCSGASSPSRRARCPACAAAGRRFPSTPLGLGSGSAMRPRGMPARGEPRRRGLHPLHLGDDVDAQGSAAPAPRPHREPVEHRRAPAPGPRRSHVDGDLAVLELRLSERALRCHDARWLPRPARSVRRGGCARIDRARALHRVLRHAEYRWPSGSIPTVRGAICRRCARGRLSARRPPCRW